jgi:eukaryotic-like serine/threonine-protein kinase
VTELPVRIGRYRIEGRLAGGAMGVVYKAHDPEIDRTVAIKLIRADLLEGSERDSYLARFQREAQAAGRCMHPNIVGIYDFAMHEGNPFLTMEYVPGQSLSQSLARGMRFDVSAAVSVILQVLAALGCAHGQGVVHRDIKPANILLLPNGQVKVTDFGISRFNTSSLTEIGSVVGTPSYMSPEQCRGDEVDLRADLFSTAAVLFELVSGTRLFFGSTQTQVLFALLNQDTPHLHERMQSAPAALDRVLQKALAKNPDQRFASADAMAQALREAVLEAPGGGLANVEAATVLVQAPGLPSEPSVIVGGAEFATDDALISTLERKLAHYTGPIARLLVQSAIKKTDRLDELFASLARNIENPGDRERFLHEARSHFEMRGRGGASTRSGLRRTASSNPPTAGFSSVDLKRIERELARYVGPIAKVLVGREAAKARSLPELWDALALNIETGAERAAFMSKRES